MTINDRNAPSKPIEFFRSSLCSSEWR